MRSLLCSTAVRAAGALVTALLLVAPSLGAQQAGTLTGRVTDAGTGLPMASVQVYIPSLDVGVLSQQNGRYLLLNVPAGTHMVTAERIGYRALTLEVTVGAGASVALDFRVTQMALQLDEIIVTGTPGGTQRRAIGNAVSRLDIAEVTENVAITNFQDLLQGRTPSVRFQRLSGNIGSGSPITIRGVSSLQLDGQPLIYIDGVRVNNTHAAGPDIGLDPQANALNEINPNDIESIEIIKGPAAATLYGTEASAGVIQIITKRGRAGAPEFTFTTRQGTNFMIDPAGKLGTQYGCRSTRATPCPAADIFQYNIYEEERDYNGNTLYDYGHAQSYNLSVRGGTDQVRYFVSGEWTDDQGIVDFNFDRKSSLRANLSLIFSEDLTVDISSGFVDGHTRFAAPVPNDGGIWQDMQWSCGYCLNSNRDQTGETRLSLRGFQEHTPEAVAEQEATRGYTRFTGSMTAQHTYSDWLTQRLVFGLDKGWDVNRRFHPVEDVYNGYTESRQGELFYGRPITTHATFDYALNGLYDLNESIRFTTSVGAQYYIRQFEELANTARGFGVPLQESVNQAATIRLPVGFRSTEEKSLGFYGQEMISWNDRLFVTGALRFDDNSAFGTDFEALIYPKLSATWVISEENFWSVGLVNSLRLRGAWGASGRQPGVLAAQNTFTAIPGPGGLSAIVPQSPGNPEVGPEKTTELELGFDVAVLDDRLSAEFTYYSQKVKDALVRQPLPPSVGTPGSIQTNLGQLDVWGWEVTMNARFVEADNVSFDLGISADYNENEITFLGEGILESANFQLGHPYPSVVNPILLFAEMELDANGDPIPFRPNRDTWRCDAGTGPFGNLRGGAAMNCDSIPGGLKDLLYGPAFPKYVITVSPSLTLFNSLQIFATAEGQYGKWVADIDQEWKHHYNNTLMSLQETDPYWVASNRTFVDDERWYGRTPSDFWKLREVGARYQLPSSYVERFGADRASVSISGRNLWTMWMKWREDLGGANTVDPEYTGPQTRRANFGLWDMPPIANLNITMRVTF